MDDIFLNVEKSAYRLGTIVINENFDSKTNTVKYNIVDGQQRTLTIYLIAKALLNYLKTDVHGKELVAKILNRGEKLDELEPKSGFEFTNDITRYNLYTNYKTIERRVCEFSPEAIYFFFHKCELVQVIISDVLAWIMWKWNVRKPRNTLIIVIWLTLSFSTPHVVTPTAQRHTPYPTAHQM